MSVYFHTLRATTPAELALQGPLTLFHGDIIDERGKQAIDVCAGTCTRLAVRYDVDALSISIGAVTTDIDTIADLLAEYDGSQVALEATTMGFAELFVMVNGLIRRGRKTIDVVYVEPDGYRRTHRGTSQFELTATTHGYQPIPLAVIDLGGADVEAGVFFLGFEPERLARALEEHQMIANKELKVIFGVPAYRAGWELDSVVPHVHLLEQTKTQIEYCSANDPEAAFECLERTRRTLSHGSRMFVAPIGPKPCGIASAVFASIYPSQVGLLFDHPKRKAGRSDGAQVWHRYVIEIA
jgi:hypothetical protein